jgi:hypothetical protein
LRFTGLISRKSFYGIFEHLMQRNGQKREKQKTAKKCSTWISPKKLLWCFLTPLVVKRTKTPLTKREEKKAPTYPFFFFFHALWVGDSQGQGATAGLGSISLDAIGRSDCGKKGSCLQSACGGREYPQPNGVLNRASRCPLSNQAQGALKSPKTH